MTSREQFYRSRYGVPESAVFVTGIDLFSEVPCARAPRAVRSARDGPVTRSAQEEQRKALERARKFGVEPTTVLQETLQRRKRLARFGVDSLSDSTGALKGNAMMEVDAAEAPRQPDAAEQQHDTALHVHGVDTLSNDDVLQIFIEYGPDYVEWINDSSCNVVWKDAHGARRALLHLCDELPATSAEIVQAQQAAAREGIDATAAVEAILARAWRRIKPQVSPVVLYVRYAFSGDQKRPEHTAQCSRYYAAYGMRRTGRGARLRATGGRRHSVDANVDPLNDGYVPRRPNGGGSWPA